MQRVVFLHEELMKLPSFPRKALEADLDLYKGGEMGKVSLPNSPKIFQFYAPHTDYRNVGKGATRDLSIDEHLFLL